MNRKPVDWFAKNHKRKKCFSHIATNERFCRLEKKFMNRFDEIMIILHRLDKDYAETNQQLARIEGHLSFRHFSKLSESHSPH